MYIQNYALAQDHFYTTDSYDPTAHTLHEEALEKRVRITRQGKIYVDCKIIFGGGKCIIFFPVLKIQSCKGLIQVSDGKTCLLFIEDITPVAHVTPVANRPPEQCFISLLEKNGCYPSAHP